MEMLLSDMINMRLSVVRFILFLLLFATSSASLHAVELGDIKLNFITAVGVGGSEVREFVFSAPNASFSDWNPLDNRISELVWSNYASPLVSVRAELTWKNLFSFAEFKTAVPMLCGRTEDFDFMTDSSGDISQYSQHENYLDKNFSFHGGIFYIIPSRVFPLQIGLGFLYQNRKWSAFNGYTQYPPSGQAWTGREVKQNVQGNIISYEQSILAGSLEFRIPILRESEGGVMLELSFCPALGFIETLDSHYLRNKQFADKIHDRFSFSFSSIGWYKNFYMCIGGSVTPVLVGTTLSGAIGSSASGMTKSSTIYSGTTWWSWTVLFGCRF